RRSPWSRGHRRAGPSMAHDAQAARVIRAIPASRSAGVPGAVTRTAIPTGGRPGARTRATSWFTPSIHPVLLPTAASAGRPAGVPSRKVWASRVRSQAGAAPGTAGPPSVEGAVRPGVAHPSSGGRDHEPGQVVGRDQVVDAGVAGGVVLDAAHDLRAV